MKSKRLYWLAPVVALVFAGCLISVTEVIPIDLQGNVTFTDGLVWETVDLGDYDVDLTLIQRIERIDLDGIVRNDTVKSQVDVYISENSTYRTAAAVQAATDVLPVLIGYLVPANSTDTLTIPEARTFLQLSDDNWLKVKDLLMTGRFTVYFTSKGGDIKGEILEANLYLTITAKP